MHHRPSVPAARVSRSVAAALVTLLGACASGSTHTVSVDQRRVAVDFLWYQETPTGTRGGTAPAELRLEPNDVDRVRIGIFESGALQTGEMWRATIWLSSFQAAMEVGADPARWVVAIETPNSDRVDGPSAGGLLTTALMAAMTGAPTRDGFTMTGTINPDGTIGPVGGVPQKIAGAIAAGKTVIGFPAGQRMAEDPDGGPPIDLVTRYATDDIELVELGDVRDAYAAMTGTPLPPQPALARPAMALPAHVVAPLTRQTNAWLEEAANARATTRDASDADELLRTRWEDVDRQRLRAAQLLADGHHAAAYWRAATMHVEASSLALVARLATLIARDDFRGAADYAKARISALDQRLGATTEMFQRAAASSPGDLMTLIDGLEAFGTSLQNVYDGVAANEEHGQRLAVLMAAMETGTASEPEMRAQVRQHIVQLLYKILSPVVIAEVNLVIAGENLAWRPEVAATEGRSARADLTPTRREIDRLVTLLGAAARANQVYFESTTLAQVAQHLGVSDERVQSAFKDPIYAHVRKAPLLAHILEDKLGEGSPQLAMVELSAGFSVYIATAVLVAKYYSVGFELDDGGAVTSVRRPDALSRMISLAELKAREHAAQARDAVGEVPTASLISYQIARAYDATGDLGDAVQALEQYWRSSLLSKLVVLLKADTLAR